MGRFTRTSMLALALAAATAGCMSQNRDVSRYRKVLDEGIVPATQPAADEPLTLVQALTTANATSEQLAIRGEQYVQALIQKDQAAGAFMPTISLAPSYFRQQEFQTTTGTGSGAITSLSSTERLDVPVVGQMNLFNGFRDVAALRAAAANTVQQRQLLLDLRQNILLNVARVYFQVLRSERTVDVLAVSLRVQEERVRDIKARQRAGLARPLDVAQTEAQASATRVQLLQARNDVQTGRETLAYLVGIPLNGRPLQEQFALPATLAPMEDLQAQAHLQRRDLLAAASAVAVAEQSVQAALGRYFPSVTLNVNYFLSRESFPTESEWSGLLTANLPIFSANQIESAVRTAWSALRQAKLAENLLNRQVNQDVAVAYENFQSSQSQLDELQTQVRAAREAFQQADQSYNVGLATNLERLIAQTQQLNAELQYTSQRFNHVVLYLNLLRTAGRMDEVIQFPAATQPTTMPTTQPTTTPATTPAPES